MNSGFEIAFKWKMKGCGTGSISHERDRNNDGTKTWLTLNSIIKLRFILIDTVVINIQNVQFEDTLCISFYEFKLEDNTPLHRIKTFHV